MEKWVSWILTPGRIAQRCMCGHFYHRCVCPAERQVFLATWKDIPNENELQYQIKECHLNAGRHSHFYSDACSTFFCLLIEQPDLTCFSCTLNCKSYMLKPAASQAKSYFHSISFLSPSSCPHGSGHFLPLLSSLHLKDTSYFYPLRRCP